MADMADTMAMAVMHNGTTWESVAKRAEPGTAGRHPVPINTHLVSRAMIGGASDDEQPACGLWTLSAHFAAREGTEARSVR